FPRSGKYTARVNHGTSATRPLSRSEASEARVSLVLMFVLGAAYLVIARFVFRNFPFSGDEYSNYLQGEIFAKGALATKAPAHGELFLVDHVVIDALVRSKYPPGALALLALGMLVKAPWLVTPLEGLVTLALLRRTARVLFGERAALTTVIVAGLS